MSASTTYARVVSGGVRLICAELVRVALMPLALAAMFRVAVSRPDANGFDAAAAGEVADGGSLPLQREASQPPSNERRHLWLVDLKDLRGGCLRQPAFGNQLTDLPRELRFRKRFGRPGITQVRTDARA